MSDVQRPMTWDEVVAQMVVYRNERDAAKEKIDTLWIQSADRATKIENLTAERDALAQNAERVRVYKQRYFGAISERDALAGAKHD